MRDFYLGVSVFAATPALAALDYFLLGQGWAFTILLLINTLLGFALGYLSHNEDIRRTAIKRRNWNGKLLTGIMGAVLLVLPLSYLLLYSPAELPNRLSLSLSAAQTVYGLAFLLDMLLFRRYMRKQQTFQEEQGK